MATATANDFSWSDDTGETIAVTLQQKDADGTLGTWWRAFDNTWNDSSSFDGAGDYRRISLTEGTNEKLGTYTATEEALETYTGSVRITWHDDADPDDISLESRDVWCQSGILYDSAEQSEAIKDVETDIDNLPVSNRTEMDANSSQFTALALGQVAIQGTGFAKDTHSLTNVISSQSTGVFKANVIQIEGHALAGTGTQIADGFEHFFDVATPGYTVAQVFPSNFEDLAITDTTGKVTTTASVVGTSEQEPVPRSRTWVLAPGGAGLVGEDVLEIQANEIKMFAMDFSVDAVNALINTVDVVETEVSTSDVTFAIDGRDHQVAKFTITCVSSPTTAEHRVRCRVTYDNGDVAEGDGRLQVSA